MAKFSRAFGSIFLSFCVLGHILALPALTQTSNRQAEIIASLKKVNISTLPDFEKPLSIDFTNGGKDGGAAARVFGVTGVENVKNPGQLPVGIWTMLGIPQSSANDVARRANGEKAVVELGQTSLKDTPFKNLTVAEFASSYPENTSCANIPVFQSACSGTGRGGAATIQNLVNSPVANKKLFELPGFDETKLSHVKGILNVPFNQIPGARAWQVKDIPYANKVPFFGSGLNGAIPFAQFDTTLSGEAIEANRNVDPGSDPPGENPCSADKGGNCHVAELQGLGYNGKQIADARHRVPQGAGPFKGMGPPGFDLDGHDGTMLGSVCKINAQAGTAQYCLSFRPSPFYVFGKRFAFPYFIGEFPVYQITDKDKGQSVIVTALSGLSAAVAAASPPAPNPSTAASAGIPSQTQALSNALPPATNPVNSVQIDGNKIALGKFGLDLNNPAVQQAILGNGGKDLIDAAKTGNILSATQLVAKYFPLEAQERVKNELMASAISRATAELGKNASDEAVIDRAKSIYLGTEGSKNLLVNGVDVSRLSTAFMQVVGVRESNAVERRFCQQDKCDYALGRYSASSTDPNVRSEITNNGGKAFLDNIDQGGKVDSNELLTYLPPSSQEAIFLKDLSIQLKRAETILLDNPTGAAPDKSKIIELAVKLIYSGENSSDGAFSPLVGQSQQSIVEAVLARYNQR